MNQRDTYGSPSKLKMTAVEMMDDQAVDAALGRPKTYVYIAGPYGDKDPYHVIDARIANARESARQLAVLGIPYYSPHLNCAHFEVIAPSAPVEFWLAMGMGFVENAWGMWLLDGWANSTGSCAERDRAEELGIELWGPLHTSADIAAAWKR